MKKKMSTVSLVSQFDKSYGSNFKPIKDIYRKNQMTR